jgi:TRAP-type C4-dicarboxylate transport system permease small subunit
MIEAGLRLLAKLAACLLFAISVSVTVDVIVRTVTGAPIVGVFEFNQLFLLATIFLGLPYLHYRGRELSVDILRSKARGATGRVLHTLDGIVSVAFMALLAWTAANDFVVALARGYRGYGLVRIPNAIPLGIIMFGAALTVVAILARRYKEPEEKDLVMGV